MTEYDWTQFHVRMYYLAPISDIFHRFATVEGLESFFIHKAVHSKADGTVRGPGEQVQSGDQHHWTYVHDFAHDGQFQRVQKNQLVEFTFGEMTVSVAFRDVGDATEVDLHQANCATVDPDRAWHHVNCRSCWIYFMTNLRSVLAGGPDVRDHDHPNWNDSVSIGFDPSSGPGQPR